MKTKKFHKPLAIFLGLAGLSTLAFILYPFVAYEITKRDNYPDLVSPINYDLEELTKSADYTKASNWFPQDPDVSKDSFSSSRVSYYTLSIPSLNIKSATVGIGGEDLSENLIQYPGTANPGKRGNSVIFGHSILPQFYNPENYLSIFSLLPTLSRGDEINISYDGVSYKYEVEDMFEVSPRDIQILEQNTNDSFITLVTCTPPGHPNKPKRLIVRARIVPFDRQANAI